jgi:hypothetical protein
MSGNIADKTSKAGAADKPALDRRGFLKVASVGSAAAAASVAPGLITPADAYDPGKEETKARYRETEHVKAFYRTNRY